MFLCYPVNADWIIDEPLYFGVFAISSNSSQSSISVSVNNHTYATNAIHTIKGGRAAEIRLVNFPIYTRLFITAVLPQKTTVFAGSTEQFVLSQVDMPSSVITNSNGEASIRVGGTLTTSGNGGRYLNTTYDVTLMLSLNY